MDRRGRLASKEGGGKDSGDDHPTVQRDGNGAPKEQQVVEKKPKLGGTPDSELPRPISSIHTDPKGGAFF